VLFEGATQRQGGFDLCPFKVGAGVRGVEAEMGTVVTIFGKQQKATKTGTSGAMRGEMRGRKYKRWPTM